MYGKHQEATVYVKKCLNQPDDWYTGTIIKLPKNLGNGTKGGAQLCYH